MFISNIVFVKIGFFRSPNGRHGNHLILFSGECNRILLLFVFCPQWYLDTVWKRKSFSFYDVNLYTGMCNMCVCVCIYIGIWILYCYYYFVSSFACYASFKKKKKKESELYIRAAVWKPFFIGRYKINMTLA